MKFPSMRWVGTVLMAVWLGVCSPSPTPTANRMAWFPRFDPTTFAAQPGVHFIPGLAGYQQTNDYTCGPAVLLTLAHYYKRAGITPDAATEMRIARESGTRYEPSLLQPGEKLGTTPTEMVAWLEQNGFAATLEFENQGDASALYKLRDNLRRGVPTLVEWIDLAGHWAIAVGYDDRNNADPWDDMLVLADPFDKYDDYADGYTFVNANKFYWMWFDALYFDQVTWRTMITVTPRK